MTTLTQVIEAQSKLRSAETELLDAEITYNNSVSKYIAMRGIYLDFGFSPSNCPPIRIL